MTRIKTIPHPELISAKRLTSLQLNNFHFEKRHTVLTPDQLRKIASSKTDDSLSHAE